MKTLGLRTEAVLVLICLGALFMIVPLARSLSYDWTGTWQFGGEGGPELQLSQSGSRVAGSFVGYPTVQVQGTTYGNRLDLTLSDGQDTATLVLTMSDDGDSFTGTFSYTDEDGEHSCELSGIRTSSTGPSANGIWERVEQDEIPRAKGWALNSVFMLSPNDAWAVGGFYDYDNQGRHVSMILHWDGVSWTQYDSPVADGGLWTARELYSVYMLNTNDGWAVGADATIIHWDGNSWSLVKPPSSVKASLLSVFMTSQDDGYAVGHFGTIIHWYDGEWHLMDSPTGQNLMSVFMENPYHGWAVGDASTILEYTGQEWYLVPEEDQPPYPRAFLKSVFSLGDEVWAVGVNGVIYEKTGESDWFKVESPTPANLFSVYMLSSTDGWAVGHSGIVIHWDGEKWSIVPSPTRPEIILRSVFMLTPAMGMAVGGEYVVRDPHWYGLDRPLSPRIFTCSPPPQTETAFYQLPFVQVFMKETSGAATATTTTTLITTAMNTATTVVTSTVETQTADVTSLASTAIVAVVAGLAVGLVIGRRKKA